VHKILVVLWKLRRLFAGPAVPDLSDLLGYICPHQLHRFCHLGQCVQLLGWDGCGFFSSLPPVVGMVKAQSRQSARLSLQSSELHGSPRPLTHK
jgi:hypothetical protein